MPKTVVRVCSKCHKQGHNARTCDAETAPPRKEAKEAADEPSTAAASPIQSEAVADEEGKESVIGDDRASSASPALPPGLKLRTPQRKKERSKAEEAFWIATEKKLAPDAIASAGDLALEIPRISTGNFVLDAALFGGVPQARFIRFTGLPKSGKTGQCLNTCATYQQEHCSECFQRQCGCANRDVPDILWIDAEHRMDKMLGWGLWVFVMCLIILFMILFFQL